MIQVDLRQIPPTGKMLIGQTEGDVFGLAPDDPVKSESPLSYRLEARRSGDFLNLEGSIEATFSLECGRCLERYLFTVRTVDYRAEIEVENRDIIDLTPTLREDILLDLPGYPRCENGNVEPRECPAKGEFETRASADSPDGSPDVPDSRNVWGALDDIDLKP